MKIYICNLRGTNLIQMQPIYNGFIEAASKYLFLARTLIFWIRVSRKAYTKGFSLKRNGSGLRETYCEKDEEKEKSGCVRYRYDDGYTKGFEREIVLIITTSLRPVRDMTISRRTLMTALMESHRRGPQQGIRYIYTRLTIHRTYNDPDSRVYWWHW